MGGRCSCLRSQKLDANDLSLENNNAILQNQQEDGALNNVSVPEEVTLPKKEISLSDLIILQSVLRGCLDRHRSKKISSIVLASSQKSLLKTSADQIQMLETLATSRTPKRINNFQFEVSQQEIELTKRPQIQLDDKSVYTGEWNSLDQRHGKGVQIWPDGTRYDGHWAFGKINGKGRMMFPNGDVYQGQWANNLQDGIGKLQKATGSFYEGEWSKNNPHGTGMEKTSNNDIYEGNFKNGRKFGFGVMKWNDGRTFHGQWANDALHGSGVFVWKNKRVYTGTYADDKKNGFGVFQWPDGRVYKGMWVDGQKDGLGVYTTHKGFTRAGEWKEGKRIRWID